MKKPQKKKELVHTDWTDEVYSAEGYNCACDEWEKFLPDLEEITKILTAYGVSEELGQKYKLSRMLAKRIGKPYE